MRRFIKTTHIRHHEGDEIAGHYPVTLGVLEGKHTAFLLDRILHDLLQRKHFFLDQCADANINPGGRFLPSGIYELFVRAFAPSGHSDFLGEQDFAAWLRASRMALCSICFEVQGQTKAGWPQQSEQRPQY